VKQDPDSGTPVTIAEGELPPRLIIRKAQDILMAHHETWGDA